MNLDLFMQTLSVAAIPLLLAITLHEAAHGWMALRCGDQTALLLGRISANPVKHIDKTGTLIIPILTLLFTGFIFGWAKPVPINTQNFRYLKRDIILVALAGPFSNLAMVFFWGAIGKILLLLAPFHTLLAQKTAFFFTLMAQYGILINTIFLCLNLLPLPPLDGSRVVSALLPAHAQTLYARIEPFGTWILLGLVVLGVLGQILTPFIQWIMLKITLLYGLPPLQGI